MKILSPTYPGSILICSDCGCLFAYNQSDLYENQFVYCPVCHIRQRANLNLNYEGEVKNESKSKIHSGN